MAVSNTVPDETVSAAVSGAPEPAVGKLNSGAFCCEDEGALLDGAGAWGSDLQGGSRCPGSSGCSEVVNGEDRGMEGSED